MNIIKRKTNGIKIPKENEEKKVAKENELKKIEKNENLILSKENTTPDTKETQARQWFTLHLEIDLISWILFGIALLTRLYHLDQPRSVVFDELHFVKHVAMYIRRIFYFDTHPPFGKQLVAAAAFLAGYDGSNRPDKIGADYASSVPVWSLRFVPALFGSFLVPLAYHTSRAVGTSRWAAALAGFLFITDSAWLVQSRFVLMEPMLMTFSLLGLLAVLRADRNQRELFRCLWLSAAGIAFACASAIKQAGLLSTTLGILISLHHCWKLIGDREKSGKLVTLILSARALSATLAFAITYLTIWWCHMTVLIRAGPHDHVMTSAFQASLEGGLASITRGQPLLVAHGSQVTLRHTHGRACWLHSHNQVYPIRYPDGRGSSHQQQVTCYSFKDVNNWWIVKRPGVESLRVAGGEGSIDAIKHGDVIELVHGMSSRALNSHDVAAPVSPQMQEVSCYIDYNVSMPAQALWRVEILNGDSSGSDGAWHAIQSQVRLIHVTTDQALRYTGRQLPSWAFNQHEVATSQELTHDHAVWNVEEHRYTRWEDQKDRERDLLKAEMIPTEPSRLSFWAKWRELEYKMWMGGSTSNTGSTHAYASEPSDWPLMYRPLAYWLATQSNAQIHLIGNIIVWWTGSLMALLYLVVLIGQLGRRQRGFLDISESAWQNFLQPGRIFLIGWAINFFPYFLTERTLFLHHYLPASAYKSLLLAACIDHLNRFIWSTNPPYRRWLIIIFRLTLFVWCALVLYVFRRFSVFAYGHQPLSASQIMSLRWRDSWDFIIHRQ